MVDTGAFFINLLAAGVAYSTPLLFATLGEIISERAGVLNLGLEGLMLAGAMAGVGAGLYTGSACWGLLAAGAVGAGLGTLHALMSVSLRADQVVSGLGVGFLGMGLASVLGAPLVGQQGALEVFSATPLAGLSQLPLLGPLLFAHSALVYLALLSAPLLWLLLHRTRTGLHLRAVGENPEAADSLGVRVVGYRYLAVMAGGAMAGVGGGTLSLWLTPGYVDGMTAGVGFVALGLTIFARWNPLLAVPGAILFGALRRLPLDIQGLDVAWLSSPSLGYFFNMLPYLFVVLVLATTGARAHRRGVGAPAALARAFVRGERR